MWFGVPAFSGLIQCQSQCHMWFGVTVFPGLIQCQCKLWFGVTVFPDLIQCQCKLWFGVPVFPGLQLEGKMIIDLKDPNRPRFTLQELRQVLMERNELKTRLLEVEDELNHYRPR